MSNIRKIAVIGGGLAGSECALQLANRGNTVTLFEMKPETRSPAHHSLDYGEIVCSNSFGNLQLTTASGLLKQELRTLNCQLIGVADHLAVPAGNALAVDRDAFSAEVTRLITAHTLITRVCQDVTEIPDGFDVVVIATGPMTTPGLSSTLQSLVNQQQLYFFDAAAPIVTRESINMDTAFMQDRYNQSAQQGQPEDDSGSYINCPLDKDQYLKLIDLLINGEKTPLKSFEAESASYFESCLPVEVIASRGVDTLRYGPLKPVGITNPHCEEQPYAVVQLRQDNLAGTLYNLVGFQTNLKWGVQKEMIQCIPGLENAEVVRYGVMHRNTYLNSPEVLLPTLQLKAHPQILIAGQLTGTEGYTESIASGLFSALNAERLLQGNTPFTLPTDTMLGALLAYITRPEAKQFQPINSNWGILPELGGKRMRDKKARNLLLAERALMSLKTFLTANGFPVPDLPADVAQGVPQPTA